jgi:hypothetical protein
MTHASRGPLVIAILGIERKVFERRVPNTKELAERFLRRSANILHEPGGFPGHEGLCAVERRVDLVPRMIVREYKNDNAYAK